MVQLQESRPATVKSKKGRWFIHRLLVAFAAVVFILLAIRFIAFLVIDAGFIENQINHRIQQAAGGLYSVEIESIDFSFTNRAFRASGISLRPLNPKTGRMQGNGQPSFRYEISISGFALEGIDLFGYLSEDKIKMNALRVDEPVISFIIDEEMPPGNEGNRHSGDEEPLHARLAGQLPDLDIADLQITNATFIFGQRQDGEIREQVVKGINLSFDNIRVDSVEVHNKDRILFSEDVRLGIDGYEGHSEDGVYRFDIGPVTASTKDAVLRVNDISIEPTTSDTEFVDMKEVRESRYIFTSDSIAAREIDYRRLLDYQDVIAGKVEVHNFLLDVFSDLNLPKITPSKMPHEGVQDLSFYLNIQEISLINGQINYSETADGGVRPGIITLGSSQVHVRNVTNDAEAMTIDNPAVMEITTLVAGEGKLNAGLEMHLLGPDYPVLFYGKLEEIQAEAFNSILVDLEGVEILSGVIDSVMFDIESFDDHATGSVRAAYRDLEIRTLDEVEYQRDFGHQIETFIANELLLRSSDEANNGPLREGDVDYEMDRMEDSFLNFLVESLLDGLLSSMIRVL